MSTGSTENTSLVSKLSELFCDYELDFYIPVVLGISIGPLAIIISIWLYQVGVIPEWLVSLFAVSGWFYFSHDCWGYEAGRASGLRGRFLNAVGKTDSIWVNCTWMLFGPFLLVVNTLYRRGWRVILRTPSQTERLEKSAS